MTRVVLVPGALALLPQYAGLEDPVAELRAACLGAVAWLGSDVTVLADPQGERVALHLLDVTDRVGDEPSYLVVGNGSACRSEKAPGHLDERSFAFDDALREALTSSRHPDWPSRELERDLIGCLDGIRRLDELPDRTLVSIDYDDDPYGVQYWVLRWQA